MNHLPDPILNPDAVVIIALVVFVLLPVICFVFDKTKPRK